MAIKTREEIMTVLNAKFSDDSSDETIALLEDVSDTITDLSNKANGDDVDWKKKYEENDAEWRSKYKARFNEGVKTPPQTPPEPDEPKHLNYDDLFKEGE